MSQEREMNIAEQYHEAVQAILCRIVQSEMGPIQRSARLVAATIERGGIIYTLGSGHSLLVAAELYFRAGGLANFDVLQDRTFGRAERLSGYARVLLESYPIGPNDLLIIVSNSGRNPLPVEMALEARARGITTIAITSLAHSRSVTSRAPQEARLFEVCDVVVDTCVPPGDATIKLAPGHPVLVGPASTLAGVFIANCISGMAARELLERDFEPPVFVSANLDGSENHNQKLQAFLRQRIRGL